MRKILAFEPRTYTDPMSDSASVPPPSHPPPSHPPPATGAPRAEPLERVITLPLDHADERGSWRKRLAGGGGDADQYIRLVGSEIVFEHPSALQSPLTIAAALVAVATVDRGHSEENGRFAILRRMSKTAVVPQSDGVEGWLWTADSRSALPMLGGGTPNLALVFIKPLEDELVRRVFRPEFLTAVAQHSPLGAPTIFGLLARVSDVTAAENAFTELGVFGPVTDREVAPAQRRHRPTDRPANPSIRPTGDHPQTSVAPPDSSAAPVTARVPRRE